MIVEEKNKFVTEADVLKILGHPIRLKIVSGLCSNDCNVKHIWECLGIPQAIVSQHLARLKRKGIITGKREGSKVHYSVSNDFARRVVSLL